jgi:hypothetical protein
MCGRMYDVYPATSILSTVLLFCPLPIVGAFPNNGPLIIGIAAHCTPRKQAIMVVSLAQKEVAKEVAYVIVVGFVFKM